MKKVARPLATLAAVSAVIAVAIYVSLDVRDHARKVQRIGEYPNYRYSPNGALMIQRTSFQALAKAIQDYPHAKEYILLWTEKNMQWDGGATEFNRHTSRFEIYLMPDRFLTQHNYRAFPTPSFD